MDEDIKNLEEKVSKLIAFCASLRDENKQLREKSDTLKNNMDQASTKLEALLGNLPHNEEVV